MDRHQQKKIQPSPETTFTGDDLSNILTRLPAPALQKFKSVCKLWYHLISDPYFIDSQYEHSKKINRDNNPQLAIIPRNRYDYKMTKEIVIYSYKIGTTEAKELWTNKYSHTEIYISRPRICNGLLLVSHNHNHLVVCNPITGEQLTLPKSINPNMSPVQYGRVGFGFDLSRKVYKVAQYFYRQHNLSANGTSYSIGMEVCTLETNPHWRVLSKDPPYPLLHNSACIGSKIYWQIDNSLHQSTPQAILGFDLTDETYHVVPPPWSDLYSSDFDMMGIVEMDGALCIVDQWDKLDEFGGKLDIWSYMPCCEASSSSHAWIHSFSVDLRSQPTDVLPVAVRQGRLLLQLDDELAYYDPRTRSFETIVHASALHYRRHNCQSDSGSSFSSRPRFAVITYTESLIF